MNNKTPFTRKVQDVLALEKTVAEQTVRLNSQDVRLEQQELVIQDLQRRVAELENNRVI